jgi:hypothetical protein
MSAFTGHGELPQLKTEALRHVGEAYSRNIRRVYALVLFAPAAIWTSITVQRHTDQIEHRFPNKDPRTRIALIDQAIKKEMREHAAIFEKGGTVAQRLIDQQHTVSFQMLSSQSPEFNDGPEAWMASQIIATWTAFEAMTGDLWEAALNAKPAILAKLDGRNPSSRSKPGDDPKRIKLDYLYQYDFDLSGRMGSIFVREKRYSFDRLDGIRDAYREAFSVDGDPVKAIMADKALDVGSLVRNNLVHNGGIIDAAYASRASVLPPEAVGEIGSPILIDGELVAKINGPLIKAGHDLVVAVDNWLSSH